MRSLDGPSYPCGCEVYVGHKKDCLFPKAYDKVRRVRGSVDVPGFDACVKSEYASLLSEMG